MENEKYEICDCGMGCDLYRVTDPDCFGQVEALDEIFEGDNSYFIHRCQNSEHRKDLPGSLKE